MKVFFCGDVVIGRDQHTIVCDEIRKVIVDCNHAVCNFEAPIAQGSSDKIDKVGPYICQDINAINLCVDAGFDIFSIANNHICDYGVDGVKLTQDEILSSQSSFIGMDNVSLTPMEYNPYKPLILKDGGRVVALFSAADNEFGCETDFSKGYAYINSKILDQEIKNIKDKVDYIVVCSHAGIEKIDLPLPEWKVRYKELIDLGVDVIIGHHPHVPQGYEVYNHGMIFYSLGNFFFNTAGYSENKSYSVILEFNEKVTFQLVCHATINNVTTLVPNDSINFEELNTKLNDTSLLNNTIDHLYNERYLPYLQHSFNGLPQRLIFVRLAKVFYKWFFYNNLKHRELLFYHLVKIDSHRYLITRYMKNKYDV